MDLEVQRWRVAEAAHALAPLFTDHEVVLTHGNGPQVGLCSPFRLKQPGVPSTSPPATRRSPSRLLMIIKSYHYSVVRCALRACALRLCALRVCDPPVPTGEGVSTETPVNPYGTDNFDVEHELARPGLRPVGCINVVTPPASPT